MHERQYINSRIFGLWVFDNVIDEASFPGVLTSAQMLKRIQIPHYIKKFIQDLITAIDISMARASTYLTLRDIINIVILC